METFFQINPNFADGRCLTECENPNEQLKRERQKKNFRQVHVR